MTNYLDTKNRRRRPFGMAVAQPAGRRSETVKNSFLKSGIETRFNVSVGFFLAHQA